MAAAGTSVWEFRVNEEASPLRLAGSRGHRTRRKALTSFIFNSPQHSFPPARHVDA